MDIEHIIITPAEIDAELIAEAEEKILDFVDEFQRLYAMQEVYENFSEDYDEAVYKSLNSAEVKRKAEQVLENSGAETSVQQVIDAYTNAADAVCSEASLFGNKVSFDCHVESDTVFANFSFDGKEYDYRGIGDLEYHIVGTEKDELQKELLPEYGDDYER